MAKSSKSSGEGDEGRKAKDRELVALGKRVTKARKKTGMTQEGLADAAGLHWTYVGQVERGERNLTYKNILKLARGLEVDPSELMPGR
jgi:transcriptional regulator with XRE-family HTH domain